MAARASGDEVAENKSARMIDGAADRSQAPVRLFGPADGAEAQLASLAEAVAADRTEPVETDVAVNCGSEVVR